MVYWFTVIDKAFSEETHQCFCFRFSVSHCPQVRQRFWYSGVLLFYVVKYYIQKVQTSVKQHKQGWKICYLRWWYPVLFVFLTCMEIPSQTEGHCKFISRDKIKCSFKVWKKPSMAEVISLWLIFKAIETDAVGPTGAFTSVPNLFHYRCQRTIQQESLGTKLQ